MIENLQVSDDGLQLTTVPFMRLPASQELIHTELLALKPLPVIVRVTSPLLGPVAGEMREMAGDAAAGITATASRSRRTRPVLSGDRFMPELLC